jgi:DNA-binding HxlR family transcriptional regulator
MRRSDPTPGRYHCPIDLTLDVIGGKWKPLILWELRPGGKQFNTLHAAIPGISHKVLTQQLQSLVRQGIVDRTVRDGRIRTVTYTMSEFGRSLHPLLDALAAWGKRHHQRMGLTLDWHPEGARR